MDKSIDTKKLAELRTPFKKDNAIFIVGNSRSGTTMMMRILNQHTDICGVNEVHFFENFWSKNDGDMVLAQEDALMLLARLLSIQRVGYIQKFEYERHEEEAKFILGLTEGEVTPISLFIDFLFYEVGRKDKKIPCDKTPQNVFYINEIFKVFPNAKVINMVRDPRAVLLSQSNKWRNPEKKYDRYRTRKEMLRLRVNYHPIVISRLWNSAVNSAISFNDHPKLINVRFEDLLMQPEEVMQSVCGFLGVSFENTMLNIHAIGSSNARDNLNEKGIKRERVSTWKKGGLNDTEIFLCQKITKEMRKKYRYENIDIKPNIFLLGYYYLSLPIKVMLSILLNLHRMKNVLDAIRRRL